MSGSISDPEDLELYGKTKSPSSKNRLPPPSLSVTKKETKFNMNVESTEYLSLGKIKRPSARRRPSRNNMANTSGLKVHQNDSMENEMFKNYPEETNKRIDYVLIYENKTVQEVNGNKDKEELEKKICMRDKFLQALEAENFEVQSDEFQETTVVKLHTPFQRLCDEAARIKLEMPLEGCEIYDDEVKCCNCWINCRERLETDNEVDFVSAAFEVDKLFIFEGHDNPDTFFRPALRCFLTHHILINMDIKKKKVPTATLR